MNLRPLIFLTLLSNLLAGCTTEKVGWKFSRSLPIGAKTYGYQKVSRPDYQTRFGQFAEQFIVRPGDCSKNSSGWSDCENDRERSELMQKGEPERQTEGDQYWYRWSILLPKNYQSIPDIRMVFGQFDQEGKNCEPSFMFQEINGGYLLSVQPNLTGTTEKNKVLIDNDSFTGRWNDIVINALWTKQSNGWFKVWVNGNQKVSYTGKTMSCNEVFFKYGIYRSHVSRGKELSKSTTTVYYDGIMRSNVDGKMFTKLEE